ncbi:protein AGENET DOMAIN (AGD)-CONTAINING P1-like [Nicotiana sylvestris]|uniref:Uncharacterized protein LOC104228711 n=1 Tax=Nicotiana sylvestris TaxID=4096 RepID=A0A1U7WQG7_NICSY|nr:PREDICTED: uncharacterized protein LOC104228711 [Nicotiana sylvestris]XP_016480906.1 PREDICTED: uncharacterized protein LOC107801985 [Nicotiana tabacum]
MAPPKTTLNFKKHQFRMAMLSQTIKALAFKTRKLFQKGDQVDVASQEYGFIGSYYTATIVSFDCTNFQYRVKYKTLLTDDKSAPLEETVTAAEVRPLPPDKNETTPENDFHMYDMVDVFDNDGWWIGFIYWKIGTKCYVYFPTTGDKIAYPSHVLRFHQEWSNGMWNSSNKREDVDLY